MPRIPAFVAAVALGNLLVPLNSTMIVVALPQISRDLRADAASVSWLVTAYLIVMASVQPIGGRVGDRFGRRELMLGALVVFALASVGAALVSDLAALIAFRLVQAAAASVVVPNGLGLLRGAATDGRAGTYFGISGATTGIGATIGPLVGGLLAAIDWRLIFLVNVPLVLLVFLLGWRTLPRIPPKRDAPLDLAGAIALGTLLAAAAWGLVGSEEGFDVTHGAVLAAVLLGAFAFVRYEAARPDPALPPSLFTVRAFSGANATIALSNVALYGTFLALPIALANGPDAAVRSGLVLTAMSIGLVVLSPVSGMLVDRYGARVPTALGGTLIAVGLTLPVLLGRPADFATLMFAMPIAGAGVAMNFPATRLAALDAAPPHLAALASGVTSTSRYFGGIAGALLTAGMLGRSADLSGLPLLFTILGLAGLAAAAVGATLPGRAPRAEPEGVIAD